MPHGGAHVDLGHDLLALLAHGVSGAGVQRGVVTEVHLLQHALAVIAPPVEEEGLLDQRAAVLGQQEQPETQTHSVSHIGSNT